MLIASWQVCRKKQSRLWTGSIQLLDGSREQSFSKQEMVIVGSGFCRSVSLTSNYFIFSCNNMKILPVLHTSSLLQELKLHLPVRDLFYWPDYSQPETA